MVAAVSAQRIAFMFDKSAELRFGWALLTYQSNTLFMLITIKYGQ